MHIMDLQSRFLWSIAIAVTENFDYVCLKKKRKNYTFNNFYEDNQLDKLQLKEKNLMFYFMILLTHHKLVYKILRQKNIYLRLRWLPKL